MIGRFVPWEIAWFMAHGRPGKALRRLRGNSFLPSAPGTVRIQRPSVREIARVMSPAFKLQRWSGVGIAVPPTYTENRMQHFPRTIKRLAAIDRMIGDLPLFRHMADCVVLEFECLKPQKGTP
jgi:hypothetical protein